jgi:rhodanese-related sulfurtransferase
MTETNPTPEPKAAGSLARDVAVLLLVGIALGLAHNAYRLQLGPGAGLSWINVERALAKFEDFVPAVPESALAQTSTPATAAAPAGAASSKPAVGTQATPSKSAAGAKPGNTTRPALTPAIGEPAAAANPPAADTPPADVPVIPETRVPLETHLAVVRKLYAANAAVFVDARSASEYAESHIAGALSLPFDDVFRDPELAKKLDDRGLPIVAYCGGGDCDLSRNLAFSLIDAGHKRVLVFLDGLPAWVEAGLPANKGTQP